MSFYGLDPCHYFSAPALSWDASLKHSGVRLELLDNEPMFTFIEKAIRGGISQISLRRATANNPKKDAYGCHNVAMLSTLARNGFAWRYLISNGVCVGVTKHCARKPRKHTRSKKIGKPRSKTRCALWGFRSRVSISFCISCGFHFPLR